MARFKASAMFDEKTLSSQYPVLHFNCGLQWRTFRHLQANLDAIENFQNGPVKNDEDIVEYFPPLDVFHKDRVERSKLLLAGKLPVDQHERLHYNNSLEKLFHQHAVLNIVAMTSAVTETVNRMELYTPLEVYNYLFEGKKCKADRFNWDAGSVLFETTGYPMSPTFQNNRWVMKSDVDTFTIRSFCVLVWLANVMYELPPAASHCRDMLTVELGCSHCSRDERIFHAFQILYSHNYNSPPDKVRPKVFEGFFFKRDYTSLVMVTSAYDGESAEHEYNLQRVVVDRPPQKDTDLSAFAPDLDLMRKKFAWLETQISHVWSRMERAGRILQEHRKESSIELSPPKNTPDYKKESDLKARELAPKNEHLVVSGKVSEPSSSSSSISVQPSSSSSSISVQPSSSISVQPSSSSSSNISVQPSIEPRIEPVVLKSVPQSYVLPEPEPEPEPDEADEPVYVIESESEPEPEPEPEPVKRVKYKAFQDVDLFNDNVDMKKLMNDVQDLIRAKYTLGNKRERAKAEIPTTKKKRTDILDLEGY